MIIYNYYATSKVQTGKGTEKRVSEVSTVKDFLVAKREETTRSHPEHGRKDS